MSEFYLIGGMALVTFAIRYPMFALSGRIQLPDSLLRALRYVPPAVLTAIVVPAVLMPTGDTLSFSYTNARLMGAIAACLISAYTQNLLLTILVGMGVFFGWQGVLQLI